MTAIQRFKNALQECRVDAEIVQQIFAGYERISDTAPKEKKAAFFLQAVTRMESCLDAGDCHAIRDACACSKGGWRLKAMQKIAREYEGKGLEEKIHAIAQVTHMGKPALDENGRISAGIGEAGGFSCPCPVFEGVALAGPVPLAYCYCCAGHFRYHYQIALGTKLATHQVLSSALASQGREPCRFVYQIVE